MNITNIFVKTRELTNSLVFKSRELSQSHHANLQGWDNS